MLDKGAIRRRQAFVCVTQLLMFGETKQSISLFKMLALAFS